MSEYRKVLRSTKAEYERRSHEYKINTELLSVDLSSVACIGMKYRSKRI